MIFKIGTGFDYHRFSSTEYGLSFGGIYIKDLPKMVANTDGDVILHSLITSILSALSMGDIGTFYNDNYLNNEVKDSSTILSDLYKLIIDKIKYVDISIQVICEKPNVSIYRDSIKNHIIKLLSLKDSNSVSITASTGNTLLSTKDGIVTFSTVLMEIHQYIDSLDNENNSLN